MSEKGRTIRSFILGLLVGGALVYTTVHYCRHYRGMGWGHRGWHKEFNSKKMLEKFSRKLDLAPDQKAKIEKILDAKFQKMKELKDKVGPQYKALRESTHAEIRTLLNPDQQAKFDRMMRRFEERRKKWEERWKEKRSDEK